MGQGRVVIIKVVDPLGESHHALLAVCCLQGGKFDAAHEEFLYLRSVVLCHFLLDELGHLSCYLSIVQLSVVLR